MKEDYFLYFPIQDGDFPLQGYTLIDIYEVPGKDHIIPYRKPGTFEPIFPNFPFGGDMLVSWRIDEPSLPPQFYRGLEYAIAHRIHGTGIFTLPETNIAPENGWLEY